jgi:hypothetical protein
VYRRCTKTRGYGPLPPHLGQSAGD